MAELAHQPWQILGTHHDDRDDGGNQQFRPTDVEHEGNLNVRFSKTRAAELLADAAARFSRGQAACCHGSR